MDKQQGKTALVTGASSGIGRELAKLFAADGCNLILVARSEDELQKFARECERAHGITATVIAKDLFEPKAAQEVYDEVKSRGLTVSYLVNDAGQGGTYGKFAQTDLETELKIIQLNVCSLVVLTKLFLRDMVARDEGRILQLASVVSQAASPYSAVYAGTKAFIYNFAQSIISELEDTAVTMTALQPGATATDFFNKQGATDARVVQNGMLADPAKVAKDGYKAMMKGEHKIVSGLINKAMNAAGNLATDHMVAEGMKKMQEPKRAGAR